MRLLTSPNPVVHAFKQYRIEVERSFGVDHATLKAYGQPVPAVRHNKDGVVLFEFPTATVVYSSGL